METPKLSPENRIVPSEFKRWIEDCKRNALALGFTQDEILLEFLDQVRHMITAQMLKVAKRKGGECTTT